MPGLSGLLSASMERKRNNRGGAHIADYIALDNSSIIYPPTEAKFNAHVFRLSAELKDEVRPDVLRQALDDLLERIPYFRSRLKEGFFWFYLAPNKNAPGIFEDGPGPCSRILNQKELNGYLFRVSYYGTRIAAEFFHCLTDGGGGKIFFLSLLARYFELLGKRIESDPGIICCRSRPQKWETTDQFQRLYRKVPFPDRIKKSFQYKGVLADRIYFISGVIDRLPLKEVCHAHGATISEFLVSILIKILLGKEEAVRLKAPVQISVPVGLRNVYGLSTLRNFSLFAVVSVDPRLGPYTLDEIIKTVHLQLQMQLDTKELDRLVSRNVSGERLLVVRFVPNLLKRPFFKILTDALGDRQYTTTLSNLGQIKLPPTMERLVDRLDFFISPNKKNVIASAAVGFRDKIYFNFASYLAHDASIERDFFCTLVDMGIPVKVYSNRRS